MTTKTMTRATAIRLASRRIQVLREKALQSNLEAFCGKTGITEAYYQGVEEAQAEIAGRFAVWFDQQSNSRGCA